MKDKGASELADLTAENLPLVKIFVKNPKTNRLKNLAAVGSYQPGCGGDTRFDESENAHGSDEFRTFTAKTPKQASSSVCR